MSLLAESMTGYFFYKRGEKALVFYHQFYAVGELELKLYIVQYS